MELQLTKKNKEHVYLQFNSRIRVHYCFRIECEQREPEKLFGNLTVASEAKFF